MKKLLRQCAEYSIKLKAYIRQIDKGQIKTVCFDLVLNNEMLLLF